MAIFSRSTWEPGKTFNLSKIITNKFVGILAMVIFLGEISTYITKVDPIGTKIIYSLPWLIGAILILKKIKLGAYLLFSMAIYYFVEDIIFGILKFSENIKIYTSKEVIGPLGSYIVIASMFIEAFILFCIIYYCLRTLKDYYNRGIGKYWF
jgi:hypothetical protein